MIADQLKLETYIYVLRDGTVDEVVLMSSSGNVDWDRAAADSLKQWRFAPLSETDPVEGAWVRYIVRVEIREPVLMNLGELIASSRAEADSLYALLQRGAELDTLAELSALQLPDLKRYIAEQ